MKFPLIIAVLFAGKLPAYGIKEVICTICGDVISTKREPVQMVTHIGTTSESLYNKMYVKEDVDLCYKCRKRLDEIRKHAVEAELKMYQGRIVKVEGGKASVHDTAYHIDALKCPNCFKNIDSHDEVCKHCGCVLTPNVIIKQKKCCDGCIHNKEDTGCEFNVNCKYPGEAMECLHRNQGPLECDDSNYRCPNCLTEVDKETMQCTACGVVFTEYTVDKDKWPAKGWVNLKEKQEGCCDNPNLTIHDEEYWQ